MYTGLAHPEVKMNGWSCENSTACTSSSILAVVSAMKDGSAECIRRGRRQRRRFSAAHAPPPQCAGQPIELLNSQGVVVKRIDPQADAEKKQLKEAEDAKKRQEDAALKERLRREKALLASYSSESDIEASRKRALLGNEKAIQEIDARMEGIKKRQAELAKELEFYKGKNKPPVKLDQEG